jgi:hypothetical protein
MRLEKRLGFGLLVLGITLLGTATEPTSRADPAKCTPCDCVVAKVFEHHNSGTCYGARYVDEWGIAGDPIDYAWDVWADVCNNGTVEAVYPQEVEGWFSYGKNCTAKCQGQVGDGAYIAADINQGATYSYKSPVILTYCDD